MAYLGGAGYPALVLAAVWVFLMIVGGVCGVFSTCDEDPRSAKEHVSAQSSTGSRDTAKSPFSGHNNESAPSMSSPVSGSCSAAEKAGKARRPARFQSLFLLLPLVLEMIGFVISAIAPGNSIRGGEGFGFSVSNVIYTLLTCVKEGFTEGVGYFLTARPLILVLIVIAFFAWETAPRMEVRNEKGRVRIEQPILAVLLGFGITCIVRAPEIYAASEVSGGVPDTYWFVTLTALAAVLSYACAWGRNAADSRHKTAGDAPFTEETESYGDDADQRTDSTLDIAAIKTVPEEGNKAGKKAASIHSVGDEEAPQREVLWAPVILLAAGLLCLLLSRYMIGATVDYTIYNFVSGGAYEDYKIQMSEWLEILNDPEITDAVLPAMNDEQGPFMLMVPTDNPDDVTSTDYSSYYGKDSVIMVEREG